jgi:putative peptide zinc metalloprotease protein
LAIVAQLVAASLVIGMAANWTALFRRGVQGQQFWRPERTVRLAIVAALIALAAAVVLCVPFPFRVAAPALVEPADAHRVYVATPGTLVSAVSPGARVNAGHVLARLEDAQLGRELADRRAEFERAATRVKHLEVRAAVDAAAAAELVVAREACADAEQRLNQRRREARALTLRSPISGMTIPPPAPRRTAIEQELSVWSGTPLEPRNQRCFLERGTLFCLVGDPARKEALVYVDGADMALVRAGQRVRLQFEAGPARLLTGRVAEVAQGLVSIVPAQLVPDKQIASRTDDEGNHRPVRPTYQVRVAFEGPTAAGLILGARGRAKIEVDPQTFFHRIMRAIRQALTIDV